MRALAVEHEAAVEAATSDPDLNPQARQRRVAEREAITGAKLVDLHAADRLAALAPFEAAEGAVRASLRLPEPALAAFPSDSDKMLAAVVRGQARAERRATLGDSIADITDAADSEEIVELAADVAAFGDTSATTKAWRAAVRRLESLHRDAPDGQRGPIVAALVTAQDALRTHRQAHPGPTRALRTIARQKGAAAVVVDSFYEQHMPQILRLGAAAERLARVAGGRAR